jgi:hypothetical protein
MRVGRVLLATSAVIAVALVPATPASGADQVTWPQVQAAAQAAQANVTQGGGTVTIQVSAKISYDLITDYRPGGAVTRERYREAGMSDSEPDEVTWTITKGRVETRYQPMPPLPKAGRYPTLRKASWVRLNPPTVDGLDPPLLRLMAFDPLGDISSSPPDDEGTIVVSWTHGIQGQPASDVTATFTELPAGTPVLQSFSTKDVVSIGPSSALTVKVGFANPKLAVPNFRSALTEDYVHAAMAAAQDTTAAYFSVRNAALSAREKAATMTQPDLIAYVRSQVAANQDFSHPASDPTSDVITPTPRGVRLTNPNAYSGRSTIWTISVTPDNQVDLVKRTKPSKVVPAP